MCFVHRACYTGGSCHTCRPPDATTGAGVRATRAVRDPNRRCRHRADRPDVRRCAAATAIARGVSPHGSTRRRGSTASNICLLQREPQYVSAKLGRPGPSLRALRVRHSFLGEPGLTTSACNAFAERRQARSTTVRQGPRHAFHTAVGREGPRMQAMRRGHRCVAAVVAMRLQAVR